ncbi:MAG: hypothetical protein KZQ83_05555 [gamma proteobacterium symbiont of Taylorina sp.]|nr:hypothetical protein [gamma proteobacterium symbiont of Taylorina sp.]
MFHNQRLHIQIALMITIFLMGSFAAQLHAAEHPFHNKIESCQAYTALEKSENALISDCSLFSQSMTPFNHPLKFNPVIFSLILSHYCIRAPPSSPYV